MAATGYRELGQVDALAGRRPTAAAHLAAAHRLRNFAEQTLVAGGRWPAIRPGAYTDTGDGKRPAVSALEAEPPATPPSCPVSHGPSQLRQVLRPASLAR